MINLKTGDHFRDGAKTMTRGGFLKGILASGIAPSLTIGAMSLAGSANASVGGMMRNVGARNATMFGVDKKPYVTDGLIAMWDGEDAGGTEWISKVGGYRIFGSVIPTDGVNVIVDHKTYQVDDVPFSSSSFTIEIVINGPDVISYSSGANSCFLVNGNGFRFQYDANSRDLWVEKNGAGYLSAYSKGLSNHGNRATYSITSNLKKYINASSETVGNLWNFGISTEFGSENYKYNVANIRVYDRVLSDDQISKNNAVDKARFNLP